jgi:hypothetical protein
MGSTVSAVLHDGANVTATLSKAESQRRLEQRREMLILQAASYAAGDIVHHFPQRKRLRSQHNRAPWSFSI